MTWADDNGVQLLDCDMLLSVEYIFIVVYVWIEVQEILGIFLNKLLRLLLH